MDLLSPQDETKHNRAMVYSDSSLSFVSDAESILRILPISPASISQESSFTTPSTEAKVLESAAKTGTFVERIVPPRLESRSSAPIAFGTLAYARIIRHLLLLALYRTPATQHQVCERDSPFANKRPCAANKYSRMRARKVSPGSRACYCLRVRRLRVGIPQTRFHACILRTDN